MLNRSLMIAFVSVCFIAAGCSTKPPEDLTIPFQGQWNVIGPDGKKLDRKYVSIDKDQFHLMTFHSSPSEAKLSPSEKTSFYVDPSKTPSHIDLVIMEGDNLGRTKLGIYAFEGEQLKVCIGNLDAPRPTAFAPGDNQVNLLLERKSK